MTSMRNLPDTKSTKSLPPRQLSSGRLQACKETASALSKAVIGQEARQDRSVPALHVVHQETGRLDAVCEQRPS